MKKNNAIADTVTLLIIINLVKPPPSVERLCFSPKNVFLLCGLLGRQLESSEQMTNVCIMPSNIHTLRFPLSPGVKAFKCNVCDSSFTTNGSLNRHMIIHLNTKPFKCSLCEESFRTHLLRRKHMKLFHAIGPRGMQLPHSRRFNKYFSTGCTRTGLYFQSYKNESFLRLLLQEIDAGYYSKVSECPVCCSLC